MVTSAFKDIIDSFIDKVKNIYAFNKEQYDAELGTLKQKLREELDALQLAHPLLAAYNRSTFERNPNLMLDAIKTNTKDVYSLRYVAVEEYNPISIEAIGEIVCQPNVIDIQEYGNIVLLPDTRGCNKPNVLHALILNMLLSVEVGKMHLSFINLGMSEDVSDIVRNLDSSVYDMITEKEELLNLSLRLNNILKNKVTTGHLNEKKTEIVIVLDYKNYKDVVTEQFSVIFERGRSANIHFVLYNPGKENSGKKELLDCRPYYSYMLFPVVFEDSPLCHCDNICDLTNLLHSCYDYINDVIGKFRGFGPLATAKS